MLLKGGQEQRRTYRGPCRKMQAMSATFYRHISCYVGDAKLGRPGLKKSVLPVLSPNSFSYKSVGGLGLFILMKSTTRGGIKNEGIFYGFPKFSFPKQNDLKNSATIKKTARRYRCFLSFLSLRIRSLLLKDYHYIYY